MKASRNESPEEVGTVPNYSKHQPMDFSQCSINRYLGRYRVVGTVPVPGFSIEAFVAVPVFKGTNIQNMYLVMNNSLVKCLPS